MIKEEKQWDENVINMFVFLHFILFVVRIPQIIANGVRLSIRFGAELCQTVVHAVRSGVGSVRNVVRSVSTRIKKAGVMRLVQSVVQVCELKNALFLMMEKSAVVNIGNCTVQFSRARRATAEFHEGHRGVKLISMLKIAKSDTKSSLKKWNCQKYLIGDLFFFPQERHQ
ncbi:hypothetical protein Pan241w_07300 [Gimesia alba]|uniref:Uncharacterized protein n=1 Tax=Gimesia alba TaxID=2527973 RepID=A0A517R9V1_9PLAN|nr:hypothetical protein [Gimesia alba]QDT40672.1 hypothetical protein Pan241w_07300 [Gimesia alba]